MIIEKMVAQGHPELAKKLEDTAAALKTAKEWMSDNCSTTDEKVAPKLITESNRITNLEKIREGLIKEYDTAMKNAKRYWDSFHAAEIAAKGIKAVEI
jgi:hypothetical protein